MAVPFRDLGDSADGLRASTRSNAIQGLAQLERDKHARVGRYGAPAWIGGILTSLGVNPTEARGTLASGFRRPTDWTELSLKDMLGVEFPEGAEQRIGAAMHIAAISGKMGIAYVYAVHRMGDDGLGRLIVDATQVVRWYYEESPAVAVAVTRALIGVNGLTWAEPRYGDDEWADLGTASRLLTWRNRRMGRVANALHGFLRARTEPWVPYLATLANGRELRAMGLDATML